MPTDFPVDDATMQRLASLPKDEQKALTKKYLETFYLGMRLIILKELDDSHKEEFEKALEEGDDALFLLGLKITPEFEKKCQELQDQIGQSLVDTLSE